MNRIYDQDAGRSKFSPLRSNETDENGVQLKDYRAYAEVFGVNEEEADTGWFIGMPLEVLLKRHKPKPPVVMTIGEINVD